jgi:hypothetical protein
MHRMIPACVEWVDTASAHRGILGRCKRSGRRRRRARIHRPVHTLDAPTAYGCRAKPATPVRHLSRGTVHLGRRLEHHESGDKPKPRCQHGHGRRVDALDRQRPDNDARTGRSGPVHTAHFVHNDQRRGLGARFRAISGRDRVGVDVRGQRRRHPIQTGERLHSNRPRRNRHRRNRHGRNRRRPNVLRRSRRGRSRLRPSREGPLTSQLEERGGSPRTGGLRHVIHNDGRHRIHTTQ